MTYHVDTGITYQEEVDEGASVLSPTSFTPTKQGWTFIGWRQDTAASGTVLTSLAMGDNPVVLYAVFRQAVTVTYYNGSTAASSTSGYRYYNSGNVANPSFTLTQAALSGWSARGWSASGAADGGIAYANGVAFTRDSSITLYGMYQQTIALTTVANGSSSTQYGTRYYNSNGNSINPVFTVSTPSLSGANWLGWCNSAGTVLYSSIRNLTLSASTTLYSGFKYNDITALSNAVIKCPGTVARNTTYTIANIPSTHLTHTITGKVPDFFVGNPTIGYGLGVVSVNGQSVRIKSCTQGGNNQTEGWIPDINNGSYGSRELPGSYGKTFTLSGSGAPTAHFQFGDYTSGELNVTQVVFHGKTVIG